MLKEISYNLVKPFLCLSILGCIGVSPCEVAARRISMTKQELMDKIKGGWAGKTIGCAYGGPTEFHYQGCMIPDSVKLTLNRDYLVKQIPGGLYDDVYMSLTFVDVLANDGLKAPLDSFANAFARASYPLWHANQAARYNILNGISAPASGHWKYNPHADDIDFQIEADWAGFMAPAMPQTALRYTDKVGHIMNYGDGWYGGLFIATMEALAYTHQDVLMLVKNSLKAIPTKSWFYKVMDAVVQFYVSHPNDWKAAWQMVQDMCSPRTRCMTSMGSKFDINATTNSAFILIGLLYGQGDFDKTMEISTRCGQDSDCNPSSAAGILGVMYGYEYIPARWRDMLNGAEDIAFAYKDYSLNKTYSTTLNLAMQLIAQNGGKINGDKLEIKEQDIKTAKYEESFPDCKNMKVKVLNKKLTSSQPEIKCSFEGNAVVLKGYPQGDKKFVAEVEILLDGKSLGKTLHPTRHLIRSDHYAYLTQLKKGQHEIVLKWLNPRQDIQFNVVNCTSFLTK